MGRLFKRQVRIFVHPWLEPGTAELTTADNLNVPDEAAMLYQHLLLQNQIEGIIDYDPNFLTIRSEDVRAAIRCGGDWENLVGPEVSELIRRRGLFGYARGHLE